MSAGRWALNETLGQLTLAFPRLLSAETVTLVLHFNYTLAQGLSGFYRSHYEGACSGSLVASALLLSG